VHKKLDQKMSYNGVGLNTARGSGTNGYVQRNLSHIKAKPAMRKDTVNYLEAPEHQLSRPANKEILDHERKRLVEIKCLELEDELTEQGLEETEIESRVDQLRQELLDDLDRFTAKAKLMKEWQTHQLAEAKERDNNRFAAALGINPDHQVGAAFNRELQVSIIDVGTEKVGTNSESNGS
jgi:serine/arginine repetitive matrix protein 2